MIRMLRRLADMQYTRNEVDLRQGTFRVRGDVVDIFPAESERDAVRAIKRLLNAACDSDAAAILLAESKEQAALIGSPNQIEAVRAGMEGRPGRFADAEASLCNAQVFVTAIAEWLSLQSSADPQS